MEPKKPCHILRSRGNLKMHISNFRVPSPLHIHWRHKSYFGRFSIISPLNCEYYRNKTWFRQSEMVWKPQRVPYIITKFPELWSTNAEKYDPHFFNPLKMMHSASLAAFAHGCQRTNSTKLCHVYKSAKFANGCKKFQRPPREIGRPHIFDIFTN